MVKPKFHFLFIKAGDVAGTRENPIIPNRIYLDVGNRIENGVLDHHQDSRYRSAAEIVCKRPELILDNIQDRTKPVEIVLHTNPDFDAIASAYMAVHLLEKGHLPEGSEALMEYASQVDQGNKSLNMEQLKTPFTAVLFLNIKSQNIADQEEKNQTIIRETFPIMETLIKNMAEGIDGDSEDSLDWNSEPLLSLISEIERERESYLKDIEDPDKSRKTVIVSLFLPSRERIEWEETEGIFINDPSSQLFRYFARTDTVNSPEKQGFVFSIIHYEKQNHTVISVDANTKYFLGSLGSVLEREEVKMREKLYGSDTRLKDEKGELRENRPGFNNPDPWYDGRGHNYTIIASPRDGSCIPVEEIRSIAITYLKSKTSI